MLGDLLCTKGVAAVRVCCCYYRGNPAGGCTGGGKYSNESANCDLVTGGQAVTVTERESHPVAPSGITPCICSICTAPVLSMARHRMVCCPESVASHWKTHCRQVSVLTSPDSVASCHSP